MQSCCAVGFFIHLLWTTSLYMFVMSKKIKTSSMCKICYMIHFMNIRSIELAEIYGQIYRVSGEMMGVMEIGVTLMKDIKRWTEQVNVFMQLKRSLQTNGSMWCLCPYIFKTYSVYFFETMLETLNCWKMSALWVSKIQLKEHEIVGKYIGIEGKRMTS